MTTATPEKADGLKALQTAIDAIQKQITENGGVFQIQMAVNREYFFLFGSSSFYKIWLLVV